MNVEMACLKNVSDKKDPPTTSELRFTSTDQFSEFDHEIRNDKNKFESFLNTLHTSVLTNGNSIGNDLSLYFKSIFKDFFGKEIFDKLVWKTYLGKIGISGSRIVDAIQLSAVKINPLSVEAASRKSLQNLFSKHKDACRPLRRKNGNYHSLTHSLSLKARTKITSLWRKWGLFRLTPKTN